jgi:HK97 family phage major capsid protein
MKLKLEDTKPVERTRLESLGDIQVVKPTDIPGMTGAIRSRVDALVARDELRGQEMQNVLEGVLELKGLAEGIESAAEKRIKELETQMAGLTREAPGFGSSSFLKGLGGFRLMPPKELPNLDPGYYTMMALNPQELGTAAVLGMDGLRGGQIRAMGLGQVIEPREAAFLSRGQYLNDAIIFEDSFRRAAEGNAYQRRGGIESLRLWKPFQDWAKEAQRLALTTGGALTGAEWVPTILSAQMIDLIQAELRLVNFFEVMPMPSGNYNHPVMGSDGTAYYYAEQSSVTATAITVTELATANMSFVAKLLGVRVFTSTQWEEDSIIPAISDIQRRCAKALRRGLEHAALNGQATAAIDTPNPAAGDVRTAWDGIRYDAEQTGVSVDLSTMDVEGLWNIKGQMGQYGMDPSQGAWVTGFMGYVRLMSLKDNGNSILLTQDKVGASNLFERGQLGQLLGSPVVVSEFYPQDMDANGVSDSGTKTGLVYVCRPAYRLGERRGILIESSRERYMETFQIVFVGSGRWHWKSVWTPSTSQKIVGKGVNIPTF